MADAAKVEVKLVPEQAKAEPVKAVTVSTPKPKVDPFVAVEAAKPAATTKLDAAKPAVKPTAKKIAKIKTAARPVQKTAAAPLKSKVKSMTINDTIKTQAETAMTQGKAAVEQIQTKAREAIEKNAKTVEELNTFARGNVEAFVEAGRVAAKGFETLTQSAIETAKKNAEATTSAVRSFASAKNANELIQLQSDFARTQFDKLVTDSSKMTEMFVKLSGEAFKPITNRFAVAADKVAKAGAR